MISSWNDFDYLRVDGILHDWEASLLCRMSKVKKMVLWDPPNDGVLKSNVDGVASGKPGLAGVG